MTTARKRLATGFVLVAALGLVGLGLGRVLPWQELSAWVDAKGDGLIARALAQTADPPPVAEAGFDRTVAVGAAVVLDGSASIEPLKSKPLTFAWTLVSVPAGSTAALDDATAVKPSFVADLAGDYRAELVVTNNKADSSAPAGVTVSTVNSAPRADAGPDQAVALADLAVLDAGGSSDFDGDPVSYSWSLVSAPVGSGAALSDPSSLRPEFFVDLAGSYVAELTVSDGTLTGAPDRVVLSTEGVQPRPDAGPGLRAAVGQTVQLDGERSSDVEGRELERSFELIVQPPGSTVKLAQGDTQERGAFTLDAPGVYVGQLQLDSVGLESGFATVTVTTGNTPPVAAAGPDQAAALGQRVQLDGSASSDVDGDRLAFAWALVSAPPGSAAALDDPAAVLPGFTVDLAGTYVAQLIVDDGSEPGAADTVVISTENSRPVAEAGPDLSAGDGVLVQLDGGASADPDGDPLSYHWSLVGRPDGSSTVLSDATVAAPTLLLHKPVKTGCFIAQLIVSDGALASEPDLAVICEGAALPVADAGGGQEIGAGDLVQLDGNASSDPDGDPLSFFWSLTVRPAGSAAVLSDPTSAAPGFTADLPGTYLAQLIVSDGVHDSLPDTVVLVAADPNQPPVADAGGDRIFNLGNLYPQRLFGAGSSDPDGDPLTFSWRFLAIPEGSAAVLSDPTAVEPTFRPEIAGDYVVELVVNDGALDSAPATATITATTVPVADAGPDQIVFHGDTVVLDGTGSFDADGDPLEYIWINILFEKPADSTATLTDPSGATDPIVVRSPTVTFVADLLGTYIAPLSVFDGLRNSVTDRVEITAIRRPPVAVAGPDRTVTAGTTVQLDGSASFAPEGTPLTFDWRLDVPPNSRAALIDPTAVNPTFVTDIAGRYVVSLVVNDSFTDSQPDVALITAEPLGAVNEPPVLEAVGGQTVAAGDTLRLTLRASDANLDQLTFFATPFPLPTGMTLDRITGALVFAPGPEQAGSFTLELGVDDGTAKDSESVLFTVVGPEPGGTTALSGRLLDANDFAKGIETPVAGATISLLGTTATGQSATDGSFLLGDVPPGQQVLSIDGGSAAPAPDGSPYTSLRDDIELTAGVINVIGPAVYLARVDLASSAVVDPATTTTVENTAFGAKLVIAADTARNPDGTLYAGTVSLSPVPAELAASVLPALVSPCNLISVEPFGVDFGTVSPQGATLTLPVFDTLAPGSYIDIWALDPVSGTFSIIGSAAPSGGQVSLFGIPRSGFYFAVPRGVSASVSSDHNADNVRPTALADGNLTDSFSMPSYRSLGQDRARTFVYNSATARPIPIAAADVTMGVIPNRTTPLPQTLEARLEFGGLAVAGPIFTSTALSADPDGPALQPGNTIRQAISFDAGGLPSGAHRYRLTSTADYGCSRLGSTTEGRIVVNNKEESPFGAGWSLAELQRVIKRDDGRLLLESGEGTTLSFRPTLTADNFLEPTGFAANAALTTAVDDLNNDGHLDIAVPDHVPGVVKILLGDGAGNLTLVQEFSTGTPTVEATPPDTIAVHTGDFDGDGIRDLAVGNQLSQNIKIFIGTGGGAYLDGAVLGVASKRPTAMGVADFDADGNDDIAVISGPKFIGDTNGRLTVFFGDGAGGFPTSREFSALDGPVAMVIDDLDGDQAADIATVSSSAARVSVFRNNGAGIFTRRDFASGPVRNLIGRQAVAAGDVDGDGFADLVVTNQATTLSLLINDGTGGFPSRAVLPNGGTGEAFEPKSVAVVDINVDGALDTVASGQDAGNLSILLGDGAGGFDAPQVVPVGSPSGNALRVADFDANGRPDVLVGSDGDNVVYLLRNDPASPSIFRAPPGDFSTLAENPDGSFTRTLKDGTRFEFDSAGQLTAEVDRNGNTTRYFYDAGGRVTKVAGPTSAAPDEPPCDSQDVTCMIYVDGRLVTATDPAQRITRQEYDAAGNLIRITNPDGSTREFAYDENHRLITATSQRGFDTTHGYGSAGQWLGSGFPDGASIAADISRDLGLADFGLGLGGLNNPVPYARPGEPEAVFQDGRGNITTVKLNRFGSAVEITDPIGRTTNLTRNADDLATRIVRPSDGEVPASEPLTLSSLSTFSADTEFTTTEVTTEGTVTTEIDYDALGNVIALREAVGTSLQRETRYFYELIFNNVTLIADPSNSDPDPQCGTTGVTCFAYDAQGNLVQVTAFVDGAAILPQTSTYDSLGLELTRKDANGNETRFIYDALGDLDKIVDAELNETKFERDNLGRVTARIDGLGTVAERTTNFTYDALNRVVSETDGASGISTSSYDAAGNEIAIEDASGVIVTFEYDENDRIVLEDDPIDGFVAWTYDKNGNIIAMSDPLGLAMTFEYDAVNRIVSATDALNQVRRFTYDSTDNVASVTDANASVTRFTYDLLRRPTSRTNPIDQPWTRSYDVRDNQIQVTKPDGVTITASYDELSRLTAFDPGENARRYTYDAHGNVLSGSVDGGPDVVFTYDRLNRVSTAEFAASFGGTPTTLTYSYDALGRRVLLEDSFGGSTAYGYDAADGLTSITLVTGESLAITLDPAGRTTGVDFPNSTQLTAAYELPTGRLDVLEHVLAGIPFLRRDHAYDAVGKVTKIVDLNSANDFSYDALDRLLSVSRPDAPDPVEIYTYDAEGNRRTSHLSSLHISDPSNRLTENEQFIYEYSENGNLISKTDKISGAVSSYSYDAFDQLDSFTDPQGAITNYRYDAFGRRVLIEPANDSPLEIVHDGIDRYLETKQGVIVARTFFGRGVDQPHLREVFDINGNRVQLYNYHRDHLGSVRVITDESGSIANRYDYDAYGQRLDVVEGFEQPFHYTSREYDAESNLYHYRARAYDPTMGRFLQEDPIFFEGEDFNIYNYTWNNPLNWVDPSGLQSTSEQAATDSLATRIVTPVARIGDRVSCIFNFAAGALELAANGFDSIGIVVGDIATGCGARGVRRPRPRSRRACRARGVPALSFAADTQIHTRVDDLRDIQHIQVGDMVITRNEKTGSQVFGQVVERYSRIAPEVLKLTLETESDEEETLGVTSEHPFHVQDRGWIAARELAIGDAISDVDGGSPLTVVDLRVEEGPTQVYNFEVDENHSYFAGDFGAWVHNGGRRPPVSVIKRILEDPRTPRWVKGWYRTQTRSQRCLSRARNPEGMDVGHHPGAPASRGGRHGDKSRLEWTRDNRGRGGRFGR